LTGTCRPLEMLCDFAERTAARDAAQLAIAARRKAEIMALV
jgi:hypothetical protein